MTTRMCRTLAQRRFRRLDRRLVRVAYARAGMALRCAPMKAIAREHGGPEVLQRDRAAGPGAGAGRGARARARGRAQPPRHLGAARRPRVQARVSAPARLRHRRQRRRGRPGRDGARSATKVVVQPGLSCMRCAACLGGHDNLCRYYKILGENTQGGYAEYIVVPEVNLAPYPERLDFAHAAASHPAVPDRVADGRAQGARAAGRHRARAGRGLGHRRRGDPDREAVRRARDRDRRQRRQARAREGARRGRRRRTTRAATSSPSAQQLTGKRGVDAVIEHVGGEVFAGEHPRRAQRRPRRHVRRDRRLSPGDRSAPHLLPPGRGARLDDGQQGGSARGARARRGGPAAAGRARGAAARAARPRRTASSRSGEAFGKVVLDHDSPHCHCAASARTTASARPSARSISTSCAARSSACSGPNGAGKTTTISMACGVVTPTRGTVAIGGVDLAKRPARGEGEARARAAGPRDLRGAVGDPEPRATSARCTASPAPSSRERIDWALDVVGLRDRATRAGQAVLGRHEAPAQHRGAGSLHKPELLVLDEPTVGVDPQSRNHIFETVKRAARGRA